MKIILTLIFLLFSGTARSEETISTIGNVTHRKEGVISMYIVDYNGNKDVRIMMVDWPGINHVVVNMSKDDLLKLREIIDLTVIKLEK